MVAFDGDSDTECPESVVDKGHGEECTGDDSQADKEEANENPENGEQCHEGSQLLHETTVMEDDCVIEVVERKYMDVEAFKFEKRHGNGPL
ncbi:hypothetical protein F0562_033660 [Nyssa sinensis]|uniref:Uncharacterized protein n=1 Tax=Nyssa sinensis TaxID=561372 RepID=A0A5J5AK88_9ASTE|nr:hypothetical protein F0562_033660 [Nyssa sinensis]